MEQFSGQQSTGPRLFDFMRSGLFLGRDLADHSTYNPDGDGELSSSDEASIEEEE